MLELYRKIGTVTFEGLPTIVGRLLHCEYNRYSIDIYATQSLNVIAKFNYANMKFLTNTDFDGDSSEYKILLRV